MKINPFCKSYGARKVLELPELMLGSGSILAVVGANGSGKSTMARILAGATAPDGGVTPLNGVSVGYMPQKSYGFRMSVEANIRLNGGDAKRAARLMEGLGIAGLAKVRGDRLSGGETARMALARLMMGRYGLVILDEPTAAMDMESTALSEELIKEYRAETGCAMILVTHSLRQARRIADEALFLHGGRLWERGPVNEVLFAPERPETLHFLEFYGV